MHLTNKQFFLEKKKVLETLNVSKSANFRHSHRENLSQVFIGVQISLNKVFVHHKLQLQLFFI